MYPELYTGKAPYLKLVYPGQRENAPSATKKDKGDQYRPETATEQNRTSQKISALDTDKDPGLQKISQHSLPVSLHSNSSNEKIPEYKNQPGLHIGLEQNRKREKDSLSFIFDPAQAQSQGEATGMRLSLSCSYPKDPVSRGIEMEIRFKETVDVLGLGEAPGKLLRNGQGQTLVNLDTFFYSIPESSYATFPFYFIHYNSFYVGIFVNSILPAETEISDPKYTDLTVIKHKILSFGFPEDTEIWIFYSAEPAEILFHYTGLFGRSYLPPLWSLGYHQSRWSYKSQKKIAAIVNKFQKKELPLDAIYLDIHYMDRYRVFTWHPQRFPDYKVLAQKLRNAGIRTVVIVDPGIATDKEYDIYREGLDQDLFLRTSDGEIYRGKVWPGETAFPDFFMERARQWWAEKHEKIFNLDVDGIWNDMNDPVLRMGKENNPYDETVLHRPDGHSGKKFSHPLLRNLYANKEAEATRLAFDRYKQNERPFILTRSAFSGIQKFAALWTGDNYSSWEQLRENLSMVMNLGLSGVAISGADVGGFASRKGMLGMLRLFHNRELFARWMQLGAWMPFFRGHSVRYSVCMEPWCFGKRVLEISRKAIRRRLRFLPYIYSISRESSISGSPLIRPLFYDYPEIFPAAREFLDQEFFVGDKILVAPVLEKSAGLKKLYLPPDTWIDYNSGKVYKGDQILSQKVQLENYPLFIKAGAAIAQCIPSLNSEKSYFNEPGFSVFPGEQGSQVEGSFYLDDGISRDFHSDCRLLWQVQGEMDKNGNLDLYIRQINKNDTKDGLEKTNTQKCLDSLLDRIKNRKLKLRIALLPERTKEYDGLSLQDGVNIKGEKIVFDSQCNYQFMEFSLPVSLLEEARMHIS